MRCIRRYIALLLVLLLIPCASVADESIVYYNPDGGSYFHANKECPSISSTYYPVMQAASPVMLRTRLMTLSPCLYCITEDALNTWYGGTEFWGAWAVARYELTAMGQRPYAPLSWIISPEKDEILISVLFLNNEMAQCCLTYSEELWKLEEIHWLPAIQ